MNKLFDSLKEILQNPKFKNPIFWTSLVAVVAGAGGIDFNTLTSWQLLGDAFLRIINNPVAVVAVIVGLIGVFNDNGTPGMDKLKSRE